MQRTKGRRGRRGFWRSFGVLLLFAAAALAYQVWRQGPDPSGTPPPPPSSGRSSDWIVEQAYHDQRSGIMVEVSGEVERVLRDDNEGSRHQRFIMRLTSGRTLLVAHNIDLAERVALQAGDRLEARGQYEWNENGGVLHWTHHDPQGSRDGGWIRHDGRTYR